MENSWSQPIWHDQNQYQDHMPLQENMAPYPDHKEYPKEYPRSYSQTQNRQSSEYLKNNYQNNYAGARKSKGLIEDKDEDGLRYGHSPMDNPRKDNEYGNRKHYSSSSPYSPTFSHNNQIKRQQSHDRPLQRHSPRLKMFERGRMEDGFRVPHDNSSNARKLNMQAKKDVSHVRCHSPTPSSPQRLQSESQKKPSMIMPLTAANNGCCTSCVLCRMPNNYFNPCCLCELPVCESCLKTDRNITNWRSRITCFMSKPSESVEKIHTQPKVYHDDDSDCSTCATYKNHKPVYKSDQPIYHRPSVPKHHPNVYISESSTSFKNHQMPRRRRSSNFHRRPHQSYGI